MGALSYLRLFGLFLPCFEKEEDRKARQALEQINSVGESIRWYPKGGCSGTSSSAAVRSVVGFFKQAASAISSNSSHSQPQEPEHVAAKIVIQDNADTGHPEIFVDPLPLPKKKRKKRRGGSNNGNNNNSTNEPTQVGYKLNIALKRVGSIDVNPNTGIIKIMAKPPADPEQSVKTLVTLELMTKPSDPSDVISLDGEHDRTDRVPIPADDRDLFVHHVMVLLEWERQRRTAAGLSLETVEEEEDRAGNFLTQRAQKAAHFAKRELELQQTRRSRESRKAKLVQESGGLRYTSLAMMQRQDNAA